MPAALPSELRLQWLEKFYQGSEVWFFRSGFDFYSLVDGSDLEPELISQLHKNHRTYLLGQENIDHFDKIPSGIKYDSVLLIPPQLHSKLPNRFLEAGYRYQHKLGLNFTAVIGSSPQEVIEKLMETNQQTNETTSPTQIEEWRRNIVNIDGKYSLLFNASTWKNVPLLERDALIEQTVSGPEKRGVKPELKLSADDDLEAIAKFFAGGRDYRPIVRYLSRRRDQGQGGTQKIPLEKILPAFIRKYANQFAACNGPNCLNAAENSGLGNHFKISTANSASEWLGQISEHGFRQIQPNEPRQSGDVLAYRDPSGKIVHAAVWIADGLLFTKNGNMKSAPYLFQTEAHMNSVYQPFGPFSVQVYRPPPRPLVTLPKRDDHETAGRQRSCIALSKLGNWFQAMWPRGRTH